MTAAGDVLLQKVSHTWKTTAAETHLKPTRLVFGDYHKWHVANAAHVHKQHIGQSQNATIHLVQPSCCIIRMQQDSEACTKGPKFQAC
jgi:hypothetical protein